MSRQSWFNRAVNAIVAQGQLSKRGFSTCYYRHPGNPAVRCAVGHLIPDDKYKPSWEGRSVSSDPIMRAIGATTPDRHFMMDLQRCHDQAADIPSFLVNARNFAKQWSLTCSK